MRWTLGLLASLVLIATGCGGAMQQVQDEAVFYNQYTQVVGGELNAGMNQLPAPLRQGYCYRVIISAEGTEPATISFQSEMDRDSVGFQIQRLESRTNPQATTMIAVYGFCSQGSGTIQIRAILPGAGYGALYEASFNSLDPSLGPDIAAATQWLAQQRQRQAQILAQRQAQSLQQRMDEFAERVSGEVRGRIDAVLRSAGRYGENILDEVRAGTQMQEALILEPDRCYLFVVVPYQTTAIQANVLFSRIRNATERVDAGGAITYAVCTAPSGPIQEVNFAIQATVAQNSQHPPIFGVRVAHRRPSSTERREADLEWLRNDPEATLE